MNSRQPLLPSILVPVLCALAVTGILLTMPVPKLGRASQAFGDLVHGPLFALLAAFILRLIRRRSDQHLVPAAIVVWCFLCAIGIGSEELQSQIGRSGSWHDMLANILGTTAGVVWGLFGHRREGNFRRAALCAVTVLILASYVYPMIYLYDVYLAHRDFPVLASLENSTEMMRWSATKATISRSTQYATDGVWSLKIRLKVADYSGATLVTTNRDWTAYDELVFDLIWVDPAGEGDPKQELIVKIQDVPHNGEVYDRFHQLVKLPRGQPTEVRVQLDDVLHAPRDRLMDMTRIRFVQIFTVGPSRKLTVHLDNMRLE